ncbi:hypothetical protein P4J02_06910 [Bacillus anthracis]|uniref:hypothetical protein n=1 Tax=Bacillus anthracis TaxID=1392 RepID=UPI0002DF8AEC|nr:hypothetical protein [Bacillus anthracis]
MFGKQNLNVEYKNIEVKDTAIKAGSLFGPKGKEINKKIDDATRKITIKIEK